MEKKNNFKYVYLRALVLEDVFGHEFCELPVRSAVERVQDEDATRPRHVVVTYNNKSVTKLCTVLCSLQMITSLHLAFNTLNTSMSRSLNFSNAEQFFLCARAVEFSFGLFRPMSTCQRGRNNGRGKRKNKHLTTKQRRKKGRKRKVRKKI